MNAARLMFTVIPAKAGISESGNEMNTIEIVAVIPAKAGTRKQATNEHDGEVK